MNAFEDLKKIIEKLGEYDETDNFIVLMGTKKTKQKITNALIEEQERQQTDLIHGKEVVWIDNEYLQEDEPVMILDRGMKRYYLQQLGKIKKSGLLEGLKNNV